MTTPGAARPALAAYKLHGQGALRADGLFACLGLDLAGRIVWRAHPLGLPKSVLVEIPAQREDDRILLRSMLRAIHEVCPPAAWAPVWVLPWPTDVEAGQPLDLPAWKPDYTDDPFLLAEDYLFGWAAARTVPCWWPGDEERPHD